MRGFRDVQRYCTDVHPKSSVQALITPTPLFTYDKPTCYLQPRSWPENPAHHQPVNNKMAPNTSLITRALIVILKSPVGGKTSAQIHEETGIFIRQINRIYN